MWSFFFFSFEEIWGGLMLIPALIWALIDYIFSDLGFAVIFISGIVLALVCGLLQERNKEKNKKEYVVNIEIESLRERRERNKKYDDFNIEKEIEKEILNKKIIKYEDFGCNDFNIEKEIGKLIEKRKDREINKDKDIEELS